MQADASSQTSRSPLFRFGFCFTGLQEQCKGSQDLKMLSSRVWVRCVCVCAKHCYDLITCNQYIFATENPLHGVSKWPVSTNGESWATLVTAAQLLRARHDGHDANRSWLQTILNLIYLENKMLSKILKCLTVSSGSYEKSDLDIGCLIVHLSRGSHWKGCLRWRVRGMEKQIISWLCGSAISNIMAMRFHVAQPSATSRQCWQGLGYVLPAWLICDFPAGMSEQWRGGRQCDSCMPSGMSKVGICSHWGFKHFWKEVVTENQTKSAVTKSQCFPALKSSFWKRAEFESPRATALVPCFIPWL